MDSRIRVTFVIQGNFKHWAGGKKMAYEYASNLDKNRFSVTVFQPYLYGTQTISNEELNEKLENLNIVYFHYPLGKIASIIKNKWVLTVMSTPILPLRYFIFLITRVMNHTVIKDVSSNSDWIYVVNNDLAELFPKGTRIIGSEHNYLPGISNGKPKNGLMNVLPMKLMSFNLAYRKILKFHCINIESYYALKNYKEAFYLPNGIDTDSYFPAQRKDKKIKILFVGRLEVNKGVREVLMAFQKVKDKNIELHIAGRGTLEGEVRHNHQRNIVYHSFIAEEELRVLYRNCDVFLFPSYNEGFPLTVLEALASGLYVITSDTMMPRFDSFSKMGLLEYIPIKPQSIIESIRNASENIDTIRNLERKKVAHELVAKNFSIGEVTNQLGKQFST